jgi:tRNA-dihydrouridine synthase B
MYLHPVKIGNLILKSNIFIAPLAGYTNLPARLFYRKQGAGIAYSEMVSAEGLNYSFKQSIRLLKSIEEDRPLGIQIFGPNAEKILAAFLKIKDFEFDLIDINCGCSVKKILKSGSGATLLKNPDEIYKIIKNIKENTEKPVTLKIRSGWDNNSFNFLEVLDSSIKAGADLITFHPRTRSMLFEGKADWNLIKIMKEKSSIPVIGNGDVFTGEDAVQLIKTTGCDGIMLARGIIENPFLVDEVKCLFENKPYNPPDLETRIDCILSHCKAMIEHYGERRGILEFRKFFGGYLKGYPEVKRLRQLINYITDYENFKNTLNEYYLYRNEKKSFIINDETLI